MATRAREREEEGEEEEDEEHTWTGATRRSSGREQRKQREKKKAKHLKLAGLKFANTPRFPGFSMANWEEKTLSHGPTTERK